MKAKKAKTHTFKIKVNFDKPCSKQYARREVRDCIHGEFYTTQIEDDDPGIFRVKSITPIKKGDRP